MDTSLPSPSGDPRRGVICGTDFSEGAKHAAEAAAVLARRLGEPLILAHSVDERGELFPDELRRHVMDNRSPQLAELAQGLRKDGLVVEEKMLAGLPDDGLVAYAVASGARLMVLAASGKMALGRWFLGSVAERTVQTSPIPTILIRNAAAFGAWGRDERPLRLLVGADFSAGADVALRWVAGLRLTGPCEVMAAYADGIPDDRFHLASAGVARLSHRQPEIQDLFERDLQEKINGILGEKIARIHLEDRGGRVDEALLDLAVVERMDMLVIGTCQWQGMSRMMQGSVAQRIVHHATMSVACIPSPPSPPLLRPHAPVCGRVLAAVNLGAAHGIASAYAYSLVAPGGTVCLLYVTVTTGARHSDEAAARLRQLIPPDAEGRGITTEVEVVEEVYISRTICAVADRFNADVVVVGGLTRPGFTADFIGSVAVGVLMSCRRPVLFVPPPEV